MPKSAKSRHTLALPGFFNLSCAPARSNQNAATGGSHRRILTPAPRNTPHHRVPSTVRTLSALNQRVLFTARPTGLELHAARFVIVICLVFVGVNTLGVLLNLVAGVKRVDNALAYGFTLFVREGTTPSEGSPFFARRQHPPWTGRNPEPQSTDPGSYGTPAQEQSGEERVT